MISRLTDAPIRELAVARTNTPQDQVAKLMVVLQGAQGRHRDVTDPVEVLAAFGGFEIAMMVGLMLVAGPGQEEQLLALGQAMERILR